MRIVICCLSLILSSASLLAAEPEPLRPGDYFPMEVRNLWEYYAHNEGKQKPVDLEVREEVQRDGRTVFNLTTKCKYTPAEDRQYFLIADEGLFLTEEGNEKYSTPIQILPNPIQFGWKWDEKVKHPEETKHVTCTIAGEACSDDTTDG